MLQRNGKLFAVGTRFMSERRLKPMVQSVEDRLKSLCRKGQLDEALVEMGRLKEEMGCRAYDAILTESMNQRSLISGKRVHAHIIKLRYFPSIYLANRIIIMYVKCDAPDDARKLLDEMPDRTVVSWTTVISGFSRGPLCDVALELVVKMMREGIMPNEYTLATALVACAGEDNSAKGRNLHALALKKNLSSHIFVGSSLLDMYAKSGDIHQARHVFDEMPHRDIVSCTAIISAYGQQGFDSEAILLFRQLLAQGMSPNCVTLASLLSSFARLAAINGGRELHAHAIRTYLPSHTVMENSLIDMYSKSGSLAYARKVFDRMPQKTTSSWNAILSGYSRHGMGKQALTMFEYMVKSGVNPDALTFMAVLSGCAHVGLVNEGIHLFRHVMDAYNCSPAMEHYGCVVNMFGRAGQLESALEIVNDMPFDPGPEIWASLLGAARAHSDVAVAELAAEKLFKADPEISASYVSLSNVYAGDGRWEENFRVRKMMGKKKVKKEPGWSWNLSNCRSTPKFRPRSNFEKEN